MNDATPPPFTGTSVTLPMATVTSEPPVRLPRLMLGLAIAVATCDISFWGAKNMGFSIAVFFLTLAGIVMSNRESSAWRQGTLLIAVLLVVAAFATVMEAGFTNTVVLLTLVLVLSGQTYFNDLTTVWGRWLSQLVALIAAPGRIFWLAARLLKYSLKPWTRTGGRPDWRMSFDSSSFDPCPDFWIASCQW